MTEKKTWGRTSFLENGPSLKMVRLEGSANSVTSFTQAPEKIFVNLVIHGEYSCNVEYWRGLMQC